MKVLGMIKNSLIIYACTNKNTTFSILKDIKLTQGYDGSIPSVSVFFVPEQNTANYKESHDSLFSDFS